MCSPITSSCGLCSPLFAIPARITLTVSGTHFGDLRHNLGLVPGPAQRDPEVLAAPGVFEKPRSTAAGRTAERLCAG
jgi:hypothetical protein